MQVFLSTLSQMGYLFTLILIGYALAKGKIVPDSAPSILSKLETWLFVPALSFSSFIQKFTVATLRPAGTTLLFAAGMMALVIPLALLLGPVLTKDKYRRNLYTYGLVFANYGFMGNSVMAALYPDSFHLYVTFTLILSILLYGWAMPVLLIGDEHGDHSWKTRLKNFVNPMLIAILAGIVCGLLEVKLPAFATTLLTDCGKCMSPVAMLLTGMTVAKYDLKKILSVKSVYALSAIRLLGIPLLFLGLFAAVKHFFPELPSYVYILATCSLSMPMGLYSLVIPAAYGKDTSIGAGMALISHVLAVGTIPLIFALMSHFLL